MEADLLYQCSDWTGESATWLADSGLLLWVDIDEGILHRYHSGSGQVRDYTLPEMVTAVIPWKGHPGEVVLAMKNRFVAWHLTEGTYRTLIELPGLFPQLRTNDCKASPEGRLWCGVMHMNKYDGNGSLYCVESDHSCNQVLSRQCIPNGIVWNRDGNRMYYADSGRGCIEEYAYAPLTGSICLLRTAVQVPYFIPSV